MEFKLKPFVAEYATEKDLEEPPPDLDRFLSSRPYKPPPCSVDMEIFEPISTNGDPAVFGKYYLADVPKLSAIIYTVFDNKLGSIVKHQVPREVIPPGQFRTISNQIIPQKELMNRMIKMPFQQYKVIGHCIGLDWAHYERGRFMFNMCFVVPRESTADCMYEPMVQKLAEYLVELEEEQQYLTGCTDMIPELMQAIFDGVNANGEEGKGRRKGSVGECVVDVIDHSRIYLKLCPAYRGEEPPQVSMYMVPMLTRNVEKEERRRLVEKMDVLSQRIIPEIDGVRCVREIALAVEIDTDLVMRCIRNLIFYECVAVVPLFLYSNTYVAIEKLHPFYKNPTIIEQCLDFVRLRDTDGTKMASPNYPDVFRLYLSMRCGMTLREWCMAHDPRKYRVDERRLIQFGMYHKFLRKLSLYPLALDHSDEGMRKLSKKCDGTVCMEDLAVEYGVRPDILLALLRESNKFKFITK